jgi:hypothetical protein
MNEDSAKDITTFINKVCGVLRRHDIAQALLDHLVKPPSDGKPQRSRYARGSGAKLAKADAAVLIEVAEPFDTKQSGKLRLWKTKDRYGRLDVPRLDEPGRILDVRVSGDGFVAIGEGTDPMPEWNGPRECMGSIVDLLRTIEAGLTSNAIGRSVDFRRAVVTQALNQLAKDGIVRYKAGPRNSIVWYLDDGIEQTYLDLITEP